MKGTRFAVACQRPSGTRLYGLPHARDKAGLVGFASHLHALELAVEPDVGVDVVGLGVEVQEGA